MKRILIFLISLLLVASAVGAYEVVESFDDKNAPVVNDELRDIDRRLRKVKVLSSSSDVSGVLPLANGGTGETLVDPGADRMMFWDDSDSAVEWLEPGDNLSITGNKLNVAVERLEPGDNLSITGNKLNVADSANDNTSNVLFQYQASLEQGAVGANDGEVLNNTLDLTGASTPLYRFFMSNSPTGSRVNVFTTKWIKISGIDTITFWAEAWCGSGPGGGRHATVKLDLTNGGENANATADGTVDRTTPEWISQTLDVSSLTDGLVFEVTVSISIEHSGTLSYMGSFIAFGS